MRTMRDKIICGDCIEILGKVKKPFADLVFADPPFNIGYEYDQYDDRQDDEKYLDWCGEWGPLGLMLQQTVTALLAPRYGIGEPPFGYFCHYSWAGERWRSVRSRITKTAARQRNVGSSGRAISRVDSTSSIRPSVPA